MKSEQEIRKCLAEMERMALSAERGLNNSKVKQIPFLMQQFELWKHRSTARANILKWVLGEPYLNDGPPAFDE